MKSKTVLSFFTFLLMTALLFSCTVASTELTTTTKKIGNSSQLVVTIDDGSNSRAAISVIEKEIIKAVITVTSPDGTTESQIWQKNGNYQLTFNSKGEGSYIISVTESYASGKNSTFEAPFQVKKGSTTVIAVTLGTNVIVDITPKKPTTYSFTVEALTNVDGSGAISTNSTANGVYNAGTTITVEALADAGNAFAGWYDAVTGGNLLSKEVRYSFNLNSNTNIYARFIKGLNFAVEAVANSEGTGAISATSTISGAYKVGTAITVEAVPTTGNNFFGWYDATTDGNIISNEAKYTFNLTTDRAIYAKFIRDDFVVHFTDSVLETAVRETINPRPSGPITYAQLKEITSLIYDDFNHVNKINKLDGIEYLTALTHLHLSNNQITNIKQLKNLTKLTSLHIYSNQISNLKPLHRLNALNSLRIHINQVVDISPLENLTNLTELYLGHNQIKDIKPLQKMTKLSSLDLSNNQISELSHLQTLSNITGLYLGHNQIKDIKPLQKMTKLSNLNLSNNQISDINPLHKLSTITDLDLSSNQITNLTPLQNLNNIHRLNLNYNGITNITPLIDNPGLGPGTRIIILIGNTIDKTDIDKLKAKKILLEYY